MKMRFVALAALALLPVLGTDRCNGSSGSEPD